MRISTALLLTATVVAGCSSAPSLPSVDDNTKRPLNHPRLVELQRCVGELAATRATLTEAVHNTNVAMATASAEMMASARRAIARIGDGAASAGPDRRSANQVFVVPFSLGSALMQLDSEQAERLLKAVAGAQLVVVRGRTDAQTDSAGETALARRRAHAAADFLAQRAGLPRERLRLQWQGAGDTLESANTTTASATSSRRALNRRVEIEIYAAAPPRHVLGNSAQ